MNGRERKREELVITIGVTDLRPPLFVGMRVSFVPDTLTFSRKHSCLHSCSLGRDTHYSPLLPFVPPFHPLPGVCHLSTAGCHTSSSEYAHAHICASRRACISRERRSNAPLCVQTRMRVRLEEVDNPLALPLARPPLPFLTAAWPPPPPPRSPFSPNSLCSGAHVA